VGRRLGARHRDLRVTLGTGSLFAFPGSPFGAVAVGLAYKLLRRDEAALFEPLGTVPVGAPLGAFLISPLLEEAAGGLLALSSIPGAAIGNLVLEALRRTGYLG
jgi:energy coupling factor transporter S component ThiW